MDPTDIGLFRLAERRLAWVDQRQRVLAQNVANASTPGYKPRDMSPFGAALQSGAGTLNRTDPGHLAGSGGSMQTVMSRPGAKAPNGNAVSMEAELGKVADTAGTQELVTNLYHKYQSLFRTALGRNG
jgi:flagellar basal-body rod protein FlgB